jgi:hypothetical protein
MPEFLGHIPLGQFDSGVRSDKPPDWKREWPEWLMSFEVWCACTLYNPMEDSGGDRFQRLMHFNLGGDNDYDAKSPFTGYEPQASLSNFKDDWKLEKLETNYYKPGDKRNGKFGRVQFKKQGGGQATKGRTDLTYISKYAGTYNAERSGGWDGQTGGNQPCAGYDVDANCATLTAQTSKYSLPFSCLNWWQTTGLQPTAAGGVTQDYDLMRFPGTDAKAKVAQTGNVSMGNRMAALYGLYYYVGCNHATRNWTQEIVFAAVKAKVRMRTPNPNYVWKGRELRVYEPLPTTAQYRANGGEELLSGVPQASPEFIGGKEGFAFPKLRKKPFYSYDMLAYQAHGTSNYSGGDEQGLGRAPAKKKAKKGEGSSAANRLVMLVSPTHSETLNAVEKRKGHEEMRPRVPKQHNSHDAPKNWHNRAKNYHATFGEIAHLEEYSVPGYGSVVQACGWRPAAALFAYPHCQTELGNQVQLTSGQRHSNVALQISGRSKLATYQTYPRFVQLGLHKEITEFMDLLQPPLVNERVVRQRWALSGRLPEGAQYYMKSRVERYEENMSAFEGSRAPRTPAPQATIAAGSSAEGEEGEEEAEEEEEREYGEEDDEEPEVSSVPPGAVPLPDPAPLLPETGEDEPAQPESDMSVQKQLNGVDDLTAILAGHDAGDERYNISTTTKGTSDYAAKFEAMSEEQQKKETAKRAKELLSGSLPPGSAKRAKDDGLNEHWRNEGEQPWPPRHLYMRPQSFFCFKKLETAELVDRYRELYGNVSNLFLRDGDEPKQIESVAMRLGFARTVETPFEADNLEAPPSEGTVCTDRRPDNGTLILDLPLNFYKLPRYKNLPEPLKKRGEEHMRRIIAIYFDDSGALSNYMSADQKREAMVRGMWVDKNKTGTSYSRPVTPDGGTGKLSNVIKPVFSRKPDSRLKSKAKQWGPQQKQKPSDYFSVNFVETSMTVREWVQSPWSYQYLPYQARNSFFEDGETFSEGCTRCARPFFEYKTEYHSYFHTEDGTFHYPHMYWAQNTAKGEGNRAPQPFHERVFWSNQPQVAQARNTDNPVTPLQGQTDAARYHNWETYRFLLKDKTQNPMLSEYQSRVAKETVQGQVKAKVKAFQAGRGPLTFRKTIGNMWHEGRERVYGCIDKPKDDAVCRTDAVQGRMDIGAAKVRFGMTDYKLQRCTRYTNCCRDCAATLEFAPGLLKRNVKEIVQITNTVPGQQKSAAGDQAVATFRMRKRMRTWWSSVADLLVPGSKAEGGKFDPRFMVGGNRASLRSAYGTQFESVFKAHMDVLEHHLNQTTCRDLTNTDGMGITKVTSVDLSTQSYFHSRRRGRANEADLLKEDSHRNKQLEHLNEFLKKINEWTKGRDLEKTISPSDLNYTLNGETKLNHTLLHALHDMQYRVAQLEVHKDPTAHKKKFDPDFRRVEERTYVFETAKFEFEGSRPPRNKYDNCLRLLTYQPLNGTSVSKRQFKGDYEEVVYLYNKRPGMVGRVLARRGDAKWKTVADTHQWRGDEFVILGQEKGLVGEYRNAHKSQTRQLKQSRLFITYSLHRAVTSNDEAHLIMTKMGDAVRKVFGNDRTLCELLLFGMKLETANKRPDIISAKRYVPIKSAKKEATLFYGGGNGSSYQHDNYDTHVDSVDVDAGIEIGPTLHHPHFHLILTVNHFSYVQLDTYRMKVMFESMFKGLGASPDQDLGSEGEFKLLDAGGLPFYGDNENPYVDIRLWPTDNWQEVMAAYVRKSATPSIMENLRTRAGPPAR